MQSRLRVHELDVEGAEDQVGIIGYQKLLEDIELLDGACAGI